MPKESLKMMEKSWKISFKSIKHQEHITSAQFLFLNTLLYIAYNRKDHVGVDLESLF